jgi:hypothetical protein
LSTILFIFIFINQRFVLLAACCGNSGIVSGNFNPARDNNGSV